MLSDNTGHAYEAINEESVVNNSALKDILASYEANQQQKTATSGHSGL